MKISKKVVEKILLFLSEYYPSQYASLVTGSHVEGTNNAFSDIDIIIFTKDRNNVYNEMVLFHGLKLQTIIIPVQNLQEILWVDYISGQGTFVNMISKAHILFDQTNFLKYLIPHTKELKLLGAKPLSDYENYMSRVKITSLLFDVMGADDIDEFLYTILNLIDLVTQFKLKVSGSWCSDGKYRMKLIKALDENFYHRLTAATAEIYGKKNREVLVNLTTELLKEHGGLLAYYSKSNTLSKVSQDYLVVELDTDSNIERINHTIQILEEFLQNSEHHKKIKYYFFSSKPVSIDKSEQNIYLVIETEKEFINKFLIDHLELFISGQSNISRLLFPCQYDPVYRFSGKKIYDKLSPLFYSISKLMTTEKLRFSNSSYQIQFAVHFLKEAKNIWFAERPDMFCPFLQYLFDCWFVFTYDDGLSFKTKELLDSRRKNLKKFETSYEDQKEKLLKSYNSKSIIDKSVLTIMKKSKQIREIKDISIYKAYLAPDVLSEMDKKYWSLYREIIFKTFSILFIDNRLISYIPFIVKKIELND
ncbi:nucleotidyltransferase domain-containing protein [Flavobacterium sp. TAB 87]|uniref:nucleotidyltransferase domain-containing protein n=1 Tax=Flavobacterium sp. TAB 87 TaxID=1729581 RepID=UPI00076C9C08|nr:nucleotidyltransferase domain-containing protein [Flavobacterium sp. TAB 87]KVV16348.1 hypothetical protein AP058_00100 [Flavobacterium sp. TAB 87]